MNLKCKNKKQKLHEIYNVEKNVKNMKYNEGQIYCNKGLNKF